MWKLFKLPNIYWLGALAIVVSLGNTDLSMADSNGGKSRYVSNDGTDIGDCTNPERPCKTIRYGIDQSQKGDQVLVAAGTYTFTSEFSMLLDDMIAVRGGYDPNAFAAKALSDKPTFITGPSYKDRAKLASRGLTLLQDPKGVEIEQSIQEAGAQAESADQPLTPCVDGKAGEYPCKNVDFLGRIALDQFSTNPSSATDIWGFVDLNDNREYAIIGLRNGTAVVNVTDPQNPIEVGTIPGRTSTWRDIKVYQFKDDTANRWKAYAYVTSEDAVAAAFMPEQIEQGLQIIDLTDLPNNISLAGTFSNFRTAHNIYMGNIDYATGTIVPGQKPYAYILGSNLHGGAFRILDLTNPTAPIEVAAPPVGTGYAHDATSLVISDARITACAHGHNPCELLVDYNEDSVDIWDITNKAAPKKISSTEYPGSQYTHSGWWTKDQKHVFIQDELDEPRSGVNTTLRVMDISNLLSPVVQVAWTGPTEAADHNGFAKDDRYYMSNYRRGLTILDITDPKNPHETGFFDTYPESDSSNFSGAWGVYPYLPSGTILVSDIQRGLFLLRDTLASPDPQKPEPAPTPACSARAESAQFPFTEKKNVSGNSNILQTTIHLDKEMEVHIHANTSVKAVNYLSGLRTGFYNRESPNLMWTQSYRRVEIPKLQEWMNIASTFAIQLMPGDHTIYWKMWVSSGQLELSSGSLSVEAFCLPMP